MSRVSRRTILKKLAAGAAVSATAAGAACSPDAPAAEKKARPEGNEASAMNDTRSDTRTEARSDTRVDPAELIRSVTPLGFPWRTHDPFVFCVHHDDHYPRGNAELGPATSLEGRDLGQDFAGKDGWRMYHGRRVPGFPQHPHRGFETVTVVRRGMLDHSDSLGATARYGGGDVQWLTAGRGILHAEMFPLLEADRDNPLELFQIWLNLPSQNKMVEPHFSMLWNEAIPKREIEDAAGNVTTLAVIAGRYADTQAPTPPPKSWASFEQSDLAIWTLKLAPNARFTVPAAKSGSSRSLYFFSGSGLRVAGREIPASQEIELRANLDAELHAGESGAELLMLQARPIGEPVVQYGPFVMNSREEIQQAFADYQRTQFGGWPWQSDDPVHERHEGRFAKRTDGKVERPNSGA